MVLFFMSCNGDIDRVDEQKLEDTLVLKEPGFMGQHYYENFLNDSIRESKLKHALNDGDTMAYYSIMSDYGIGGFRDEFLFYAMMMAEKNQFSEAYFDIFAGLDMSLYGSLTAENNLYKKIADYNLIKAWLGGSKSAKSPMTERFGENFDSLRVMRYLDKLQQHLVKEKLAY